MWLELSVTQANHPDTNRIATQLAKGSCNAETLGPLGYCSPHVSPTPQGVAALPRRLRLFAISGPAASAQSTASLLSTCGCAFYVHCIYEHLHATSLDIVG